jgi:hypothetical protein
MKYLLCMLALAGWLVVPTVASAVSLSGVVLYSTDDFGNPNGANTLTRDELEAQLWRTQAGGQWHVLGVWEGLPMVSFGSPPLNGPNAMVEIPLVDGENDFTLVGQPGDGTRGDDYQRYAVNLYFDDVYDHPGISVLFPRNNNRDGSPTTPNRSDRIYPLGLDSPVAFPPRSTYDDSVNTVSVLAASFLPPEVFKAGDLDLVSAQALVPSGGATPDEKDLDFIGVLKVMVEPSAGAGGQPLLGPGAAGFGVIPGGIADSGTLHGPDIPVGGGARVVGEPGLGGDRGVAPGGDVGVGSPGGGAMLAAGTAEPTVAAAETTTPGGTSTPAKTPSPRATSRTASPTAGAGTSTPAATGAGSTPTPRASTPIAAATPTAKRHGAK